MAHMLGSQGDDADVHSSFGSPSRRQDGREGWREGRHPANREPVVLGLLGLLVQFFQLLLGLKSSIIKHLGSRMDHST